MAKLGDINSQTDINGEIIYTEKTTTTNIVNSAAASAHSVIPSTPIVYDGTPILIEYFCGSVLTPNVAGGHVMFDLFDGMTDLGYMGDILSLQPTIQASVYFRRRFVPTAGTHSFQIAAWVPTTAAGGGNCYAGPGGVGQWPPSYMRITRW